MGDLIELRHVSKTFPGVKALKDVSFCVKKGEIHGLAGENGAGKSTLIKIMTGVYRPDDGAEIYVDGERVSIKSPMDASSLGISVIYQDFSLFGNMTVAENILFGFQKMNCHKIVNWKSMRNRARQVLQELEISIDVNERVENLSVGKQQMVAIAKALVFDSRLLIMDEPTSTLSNAEVEHLFRIMEKLREKGVSVLFVTHKLDEMFRMADRISVFRDGQYIDTREAGGLAKEELVRMMVGREVVFTKKSAKLDGEILLEVEDLTKKGNYKDITFELRRGDDDDKIRLNQRKPSKYKGLSRFGPEKNLQRINKFMKERPTFYKKLIQMKENFRFYLRCFYCITKVVILQFNSEKQDRISS